MKEHICSPDGEQRERRAEGEEKTQRRIKDLDGSLSLNPSIHFSLCLTHMAGFLHVHTSSVTTKVTTREGLARPQARRRREWRGGGVMAVVAWLALSPRHLPFERPFFFLSFTSSLYLFPLLNLASGHSPPQKAGGWRGGAWHFHPPIILYIHLPRPSVSSRIRCVRPTSGVTAGVDVLFQR